MSKTDKKKLLREIIHPAGILLTLCVIVAWTLAFSNAVTGEDIARLAHQRKTAAMEQMIPGGVFAEMTDYTTTETIIKSVYTASVEGKSVGLCIETTPKGFSGQITLMVAVDPDGRIIGIDITKSTESAGGSKATDPQWLAQFMGKSGKIQVVKNQAAENDIVALTGGTVTSNAVTTGVQAALNFANAYYKGEGGGLS